MPNTTTCMPLRSARLIILPHRGRLPASSSRNRGSSRSGHGWWHLVEEVGHNAVTESRIAVVVLAWNYHHYTYACLRSLERQTLCHTVYVVDNASTDGTADIVAAE